MSILLTILKILGIVILILLGILILIILGILFIPIRYRFTGDMKNGESPGLDASVSWMYPLFFLKVSYMNDLDLAVRILGFLIFPKKEKKIKKAADESQASDQFSDSEKLEEEKTDTVTDQNDTSGEKKTFCSWLEDLKENSEKTIQAAADKIDNLKSKITFYLDLLDENDTRDYITGIATAAGKILKHIIPKEMTAEITIGTDDPASTANILAVHGMLYPWIGDRIRIHADFENRIVEGNVFIKGRIRIGSILFPMLKLVLDRRLYKLLTLLKKGGKTDERK